MEFKNGSLSAIKDTLSTTNQNSGNNKWHNEPLKDDVQVDLEQHKKIEQLIEKNFMKTPAE